MVECADGTLYSGVTTDVERRIKEHNDSPKGAKYTRAKRPVVLVYTETCVDRTEATRREYTLKQLSRDEKLKLIYTDPK